PEQFQKFAPVVNQVLAIREYEYPITSVVDHLEDDCCLPRDVEPKKTYVAVYRDPESNYCRFLEIGESAAKIIRYAQDERAPYVELLGMAVASADSGDPQTVAVEFLELVEKLQSVSLFVGSVEV